MASMVSRLLRLVPVRFLSFALVGGVGMVIHFLMMTVLFTQWKHDFVWSHSAATIIAMVGNFIEQHNDISRYAPSRLAVDHRLADFQPGVCNRCSGQCRDRDLSRMVWYSLGHSDAGGNRRWFGLELQDDSNRHLEQEKPGTGRAWNEER